MVNKLCLCRTPWGARAACSCRLGAVANGTCHQIRAIVHGTCAAHVSLLWCAVAPRVAAPGLACAERPLESHVQCRHQGYAMRCRHMHSETCAGCSTRIVRWGSAAATVASRIPTYSTAQEHPRAFQRDSTADIHSLYIEPALCQSTAAASPQIAVDITRAGDPGLLRSSCNAQRHNASAAAGTCL